MKTAMERLREMRRIGERGEMSVKGDYDGTVPKVGFEVVDEVSAIIGDTRYAFERLRLEDGTECIRVPYWTIEGRVRKGSTGLRVGFGQYSPMLSADVFFALADEAVKKGWRGGEPTQRESD